MPEQQRVRLLQGDIAEKEPLSGEIGDQRFRSRIGEHPPHLFLEDVGILQRSIDRRAQQFVIRNAAPDKKG